MSDVKRGDIFYADLGPIIGSEQGGVRPVLILQNDVGNKYSPTIISAAITSSIKTKAKIPTHVLIPVKEGTGLTVESIALLEQIRTIDKKRLLNCVGHLDDNLMKNINSAICISLNIV